MIKKTCLYCGDSQGKMTGEHVIADDIGGIDTIAPVCGRCNHGELNKLDAELCKRSPLALIAAQELEDLRVVHEMWVIDEKQNNLLIEGQWDPGKSTHVAYPQLIIEGERAQLRGDGDQIKQVGENNFKKIFVEAVKYAYEQHKAGKGKIFFEPVDRRFIPSDNRLPPRIFTRHPLTELAVGNTFILRYVDEADKNHLLDKLSKGNIFEGKGRTDFYIPGGTLAFQVMFSPATIGRAFMKLGFNALRWACKNTIVSLETFPDICEVILGKVIKDSEVERTSGFVKAVDLASMDCQGDEHRVWIMRDKDRWVIKVAFFGGRIGGIASIPGPSNETWNFADIRCPIEGKLILEKESALYVAGEIPVQTNLFSDIAPSIAAFNAKEGRFIVKRKSNKKAV